MEKGINRCAIFMALMSAILVILFGLMGLNSVIYALMAPDSPVEMEAHTIEASLVTRAN